MTTEAVSLRFSRTTCAWLGERGAAMGEALDTALKDLTFRQGETKTLRRYEMPLGTEGPPTGGSSVPVWVQDGWSASEGSVREEARQAGDDSPTVFVFLPRLEADELKETNGRFRAAEETVNTRAAPQTPAGIEAKGSDAVPHRWLEDETRQRSRRQHHQERSRLPGRR